MGFFRQRHKSAFWSQLLWGMVAVLAVPTTEVIREFEPRLVAQIRNINELVSATQTEITQAHFLQKAQESQLPLEQAVSYGEFFANLPPLYFIPTPPIRAGPLA